MNPVFAALAAVAFGLTLVGADASAAPAPAHSTSAHKAGQAAKPAKSSPEKAAKASSNKPAKAAKAAKEPSVKSAKSAKEPSAKAGKATAQKDVSPRAEGRKGKAARQAASAAAEPREASTARKTVKEVRMVKGRKVVIERSVPVSRESRSRRGDSSESPAPRSTGAIGREAFVPSSPPIPRAEAVRQIQSRNALPPIPAPNVPIPPPRASSPTPPRSSVTLPPPVAEVARAQARAPEASVAAVTPPVEAPRVAPRYADSSAELSGPEAAAAAAAALNAVRAPEPVPQRVAPAPQSAAPAYVPPAVVPAVAAPAAAAVAAPASVQSQPVGRTPKGTPRAYAMDGATFYQGGRKIRVQGLDIREPGMTSEHATQRLQRALDSGSLSVEPVEVDGSGHTVAVVRVNGRNVAETVRAAN